MHPLLDRLNRDHRNLAQAPDPARPDCWTASTQGAEPDYELMCELLDYMDELRRPDPSPDRGPHLPSA